MVVVVVVRQGMTVAVQVDQVGLVGGGYAADVLSGVLVGRKVAGGMAGEAEREKGRWRRDGCGGEGG